MSKRPQFDGEELLRLPAIDIAAEVRRGERSAVSVLDAFVQRIELHNPKVNALVAERITEARAEAQAIDDAIADGYDPGPLAGVPFTTKEMASAEGLPVTAGSLRRRGAVATRDSTFVARLRDAGALLIGVTNQSELGLWWESVNPVYGRTNNPYDLGRTSGGSSGGEGAMSGTGLGGFGVGSDMGGSIRLPALFCGVFGHKPGSGAIPVSGHFPIDYSDHRIEAPPSHEMISIGPMSRHASDLLPLLEIMSGACPDDPLSRDREFGAPVSMEGKRVFFLEDPKMRLASSTSPAQSDAVRRAARGLAERGAEVRQWDGPSLRDGMALFSAMLADIGGGMGIEEMLTGNPRMRLRSEIPRMLRGTSRHAGTSAFLVMGDRLAKPSAKQTVRLVAQAQKLREAMDEALGDDGVLILPTFPTVAPKHNRTLLRPFDIAYTALFNALDSPVTAAPLGLWDRTGMPTGVQIVGASGNDHLTISAAISLEEQGSARWIPPGILR